MTRPIAASVDGYLAHITIERGLSRNTVAAYARDLARYTQWCDERGIAGVGAVTANDIADFAASLGRPVTVDVVTDDGTTVRTTEPALAASSARRMLVAVRGFHRFAVKEGWVLVDPTVDVPLPSVGRSLPKALSVDDAIALVEAAGDLQSPAGLRDRALLELLYGTGARISEAVGLDVDDVDLSQRAITVLGKGDKQRRIPVGEPAAAAIEAYLVRARADLAKAGRGNAALFLNARGARLSRQSAFGIVQRAAQRAHTPGHVSPHTLRHSYATHLLHGGADVRVVQELLGHASVTTTQVYTAVTPDTLVEVYRTSHPRAR